VYSVEPDESLSLGVLEHPVSAAATNTPLSTVAPTMRAVRFLSTVFLSEWCGVVRYSVVSVEPVRHVR
jgi:hypothetical protein